MARERCWRRVAPSSDERETTQLRADEGRIKANDGRQGQVREGNGRGSTFAWDRTGQDRTGQHGDGDGDGDGYGYGAGIGRPDGDQDSSYPVRVTTVVVWITFLVVHPALHTPSPGKIKKDWELGTGNMVVLVNGKCDGGIENDWGPGRNKTRTGVRHTASSRAPHHTPKGQRTACSQQGRSESKQCAWWVQGPTLPLRDAREKERDRERLSAGIPSVNLGPKPNGKWENPLVSYSPTIHQAAPYSAKRRMTSKQLTATRGALSHSHTPLFSFPILFPPAPIQ